MTLKQTAFAQSQARAYYLAEFEYEYVFGLLVAVTCTE